MSYMWGGKTLGELNDRIARLLNERRAADPMLFLELDMDFNERWYGTPMGPFIERHFVGLQGLPGIQARK